MKGYTSQKRQRIDNVQQQLLTNYYLHKYDSLMTEITHHTKSPNVSSESHRLNFKSAMTSKRSQDYHPQRINFKAQIIHKQHPDASKDPTRVFRKLQDSIIDELYQPSPTKIEVGSYNRIEFKQAVQLPEAKKLDVRPIQSQNVQITHEGNFNISEQELDQQLFARGSGWQTQKRQVSFKINEEFVRRRDKQLSPRKSSPSRKSENFSSKISLQYKTQSPHRLEKAMNPTKAARERMSHSSQGKHRSLSANESPLKQTNSKREMIEEQQLEQIEEDRKFKVHFLQEAAQPLQTEDKQPLEGTGKILQFLPPSSNYYQSNNPKLVEESFRYMQKKEGGSEWGKSRRPSVDNIVVQGMSRKKSTRSISGPKNRSEQKDPSNMSMMSRFSLNSEDGKGIHERLEKELNQNELGPYQSALYTLNDLMEEISGIGPIYATAQRILDDRAAYEIRRRGQETQLRQYKDKIDHLKRKSQQKAVKGDDEVIRRNRQQILRLIRKISTKL